MKRNSWSYISRKPMQILLCVLIGIIGVVYGCIPLIMLEWFVESLPTYLNFVFSTPVLCISGLLATATLLYLILLFFYKRLKAVVLILIPWLGSVVSFIIVFTICGQREAYELNGWSVLFLILGTFLCFFSIIDFEIVTLDNKGFTELRGCFRHKWKPDDICEVCGRNKSKVITFSSCALTILAVIIGLLAIAPFCLFAVMPLGYNGWDLARVVDSHGAINNAYFAFIYSKPVLYIAVGVMLIELFCLLYGWLKEGLKSPFWLYLSSVGCTVICHLTIYYANFNNNLRNSMRYTNKAPSLGAIKFFFVMAIILLVFMAIAIGMNDGDPSKAPLNRIKNKIGKKKSTEISSKKVVQPTASQESKVCEHLWVLLDDSIIDKQEERTGQLVWIGDEIEYETTCQCEKCGETTKGYFIIEDITETDIDDGIIAEGKVYCTKKEITSPAPCEHDWHMTSSKQTGYTEMGLNPYLHTITGTATYRCSKCNEVNVEYDVVLEDTTQ